MAKSVGLTLALPAMLAVLAPAQTNTPQPTAVISGVVLDSFTRQPLKEVEVRARIFPPGQSKSQASSATTDAAGHFTLDGMFPGRYIISASRPGYIGQRISGGGGGSGRLLTVAPDQHSDDLIIELTPGAKISGIIKNADGKPMPEVSVEAVKKFQSGNGIQLQGVGAPSFTNAAGEYRMTGLTPGRYYLRAIPPTTAPDGNPPSSNAKPPAPAKAKAFAPTYYPNGGDVTSASPLSVRSGDDLAGMDITLTAVRAVNITGKILLAGTSAPSAGASVTLISNEAGSSQREVTTDAKGNFEFLGVPSGDYVLVARVEPQTAKSKMLWGQRPLHVRDSNLRNANCVIGAGVQVNGRIHVDDKASIDLTQLTTTLRPEDNSSVAALKPVVDSVFVKSDGTFTFVNVPEGTHVLEFDRLPPGYYLKSTGAVDVLESGVTIAHNQSPPLIDLMLSANAAQLTGTVSNEQMPAPGALVLLVPKGVRSNQFRFYRESVTDRSGRFSIKSIIPGDYRVLAFEGVERSSLTDPDFLQQFADRGEAVHLQEGATQSVSLDATPADEASR